MYTKSKKQIRMGPLQLIGNIIWIIFGGLEIAFAYFMAGLIMCLTIIGIPFGIKLFQIGLYAFLPFGAKSVTREPLNVPFAIIFNLLWIPFGLLISILHLIIGVSLCITIIGIPFGIQHFKLLGYALVPFGREMRY